MSCAIDPTTFRQMTVLNAIYCLTHLNLQSFLKPAIQAGGFPQCLLHLPLLLGFQQIPQLILLGLCQTKW